MVLPTDFEGRDTIVVYPVYELVVFDFQGMACDELAMVSLQSHYFGNDCFIKNEN